MLDGNAWVPGAVGVFLSGLLIAIAAAHLVHATGQRPLPRRWHAFHILMALGMLDMVPTGWMPVPPSVLVLVFGVAALAAVGVAAVTRLTESGPVWLWLVTAVDLAAMTVMSLVMSNSMAGPTSMFAWSLVTVPVVMWLVIESTLWLTGFLLLPAIQLGAVEPEPSARDWLSPATLPVGAAEVGARATAGRPAHSPAVVVAAQPTGAWLRTSLAAMSLAMAFMLLATQYAGGSGVSGSAPAQPGGVHLTHSMP